MLIGGAVFVAATEFSVLTFAAAYYSPTGGYFVLVYGLILYGAGDLFTGLAAV